MTSSAFVSSLPLLSQQHHQDQGRTTSTCPSICTFDGLRKVDRQVASTFIPSSFQVADDTTDMDMIGGVVTMRCRRDLKKEKRVRNMEFARAHRKRTLKTYGNRRSVQEANASADNEFLSSVFGTIRFRGGGEEGDEESNTGNKSGGGGGIKGGNNNNNNNRKKQ